MNVLARAHRDEVFELEAPVSSLIRRVARKVILPRFRQLRSCDVSEKTPGEVVTVADHESEIMLTEGLAEILPTARVIGEEACAENPLLLLGLDRGSVWIVDPLDGTANFAAGEGPFGIIVALARDGETVAAWLYNPLTDRMYFAAKGRGAFLIHGDRAPRWLSTTPPKGQPIAALATQFMSAELRNSITAIASDTFDLRPIPRCAAEHYPMLCLGDNHVALFQRTLPWDHAAGALLLEEAGGYISRWDGSPYRFHDKQVGILAAASRCAWERAADILLVGGGLSRHGRELVYAVQPLAVRVG